MNAHDLVPGRLYEIATVHPDDTLVVLFAEKVDASYGSIKEMFHFILAATGETRTPMGGTWYDALEFAPFQFVVRKELSPADLLLHMHFEDKRPIFTRIISGRPTGNLRTAWDRSRGRICGRET